jgi:hypothetical protein
MQRIKLVKDWKAYKAGRVLVIDNNEAFGLIDSGKAILTKDMTSDDIKTKSVKQAGDTHGKSVDVRPMSGF